MSYITRFIRSVSYALAAALVTLFFPAMAFAETTGDTTESAPAATTTEQTPPAPTPGPQKPTGPDANTFHLNPETGKWENEHYIWDPVTKKTTLKDPNYTYDPVTGKWSTDGWRYDPVTKKYNKVEVPAPQGPPAGYVDDNGNSGGNSCGCGAGGNTNANLDSATAVAMANGVTATAISGNATVAYNTLGGNATSGNSTITSNTINLLQSGLSFDGNQVPTTFVADIDGDVTGDLIIDPTLLLLQPASNTGSGWNNLTVHAQNSGQIANTIELDAQTGNATVNANTEAGNATTGDANAVANVINLASSSVNAAGSFIGTINVNGNFNGDILLADGMLDKLVASNAPRMTLDMSKPENSSLFANLTNNQSIANNVTTTAASGNATVASNTAAGSATTGNASTNVNIFNLTGHQVTGANSILVFVNVHGEWVGLIVDAPQGATAAVLADAGATATAMSGDFDLTSTNDMNITNDINVNALSGDAAVTNNTKAGNATTGDASASVNLFNMANSNVSLSGWFGILFINVFGSWHGSFGVNTDAGNLPALPSTSGGTTGNTTNQHGTQNQSVKVFTIASSGDGNYALDEVDTSSSDSHVAAATTSNDTPAPTALTGVSASAKQSNWQFAAFGLLISACLIAVERLRAARQHKIAHA